MACDLHLIFFIDLNIPLQEADGILKAVTQLSRFERWDEGKVFFSDEISRTLKTEKSNHKK